MTRAEELSRRAFLHGQAAELLRADADHHEKKSKQLREKAEKIKESENAFQIEPAIQAAI